jgi:hypothetical protein
MRLSWPLSTTMARRAGTVWFSQWKVVSRAFPFDHIQRRCLQRRHERCNCALVAMRYTWPSRKCPCSYVQLKNVLEHIVLALKFPAEHVSVRSRPTGQSSGNLQAKSNHRLGCSLEFRCSLLSTPYWSDDKPKQLACSSTFCSCATMQRQQSIESNEFTTAAEESTSSYP